MDRIHITASYDTIQKEINVDSKAE